MKVRLVEIKDFPEWLQMRYALWSYHTLVELETEMKEIYNGINVKPVFVVENDNSQICAFIEMSVHETAPGCLTTNVGFIEGWYVKPEFRKSGVGRLLVEKGEQWAINSGCTEMASDTTESYPISPLAHKALGYEEVDIPLHYRKIISTI